LPHDALEMIRRRGGGVDLAHRPQDPTVYRMLQQADTIGVFQVESRAQMATLPRLRPTCFYDLVVQVAIIRPGPIVGDMVHPYLRRRAGREEITVPHPDLEPILRRTRGVPLFPEQPQRRATATAGFTGSGPQPRADRGGCIGCAPAWGGRWWPPRGPCSSPRRAGGHWGVSSSMITWPPRSRVRHTSVGIV